nr:MAG: hypothetical protein [Bacteriophage sp.]
MSRIYDVAEKIKSANEKPKIKIDDNHIYDINISKNVGIFLKGVVDDPEINEDEKMDKIIEAGLGKDALEYIKSLDKEYSTKAYAIVINVIIAAISDMPLEEIEAMDEKELNNNNNNFRKKKKRRK